MQQVEITITQNDGEIHSFRFPRMLLKDVIEEVVGGDLADRAMADFDTLGRYEFITDPADISMPVSASIRLETVQFTSGHLI